MRRQLLLIVGLVLLINAAGWAYVHYPPWLRVEPPEELDVLPAGSRVQTTLALRNAGLSPLRIHEVRGRRLHIEPLQFVMMLFAVVWHEGGRCPLMPSFSLCCTRDCVMLPVHYRHRPMRTTTSVSSGDGPRLRRSLLYLWWVLMPVGSCPGMEGHKTLSQLEESAWHSVHALTPIEYHFDYASQRGETSRNEFLLDGEQYRITRRDLKLAERQEKLFSADLAYDGRRQQHVVHHEKSAYLRDGLEGVVWGVTETPYTILYSWISTWGHTPRHRELREREHWRSRFEGARVIGRTDRHIVPSTGVEFPPHDASVRSSYVVWFADELGCVPVAYERKLAATGEVSSSLTVTEYSVHKSEGGPILIPLSITHQEHGRDRVSLVNQSKYTIDPATLRIQHHPDPGRFQIPIPEGYEVQDEQLMLAAIAQAEALATAKGAAGLPDARSASLWSLLWVANGLLFLAIAGYVYWRRRP